MVAGLWIMTSHLLKKPRAQERKPAGMEVSWWGKMSLQCHLTGHLSAVLPLVSAFFMLSPPPGSAPQQSPSNTDLAFMSQIQTTPILLPAACLPRLQSPCDHPVSIAASLQGTQLRVHA